MTAQVRLGPKVRLPLEVVTSVVGILGKRGSGKTSVARRLVEEMVRVGAQVVVLDPLGAWWGLRSGATASKTGLPFVIIGGDHADLPLEASAGKVMADVVADTHGLVVLDVSHFTESDRVRFVADFATHLYRRNRKPLHVVLEEADAFIPQSPSKGQTSMLEAVDVLVRRGRQRGIGITMVSQRSQAIAKSVLSQADTMVMMRTTGPHDRKPIEAWITAQGIDEVRTEIRDSLPNLDTGEGWVWSPELGIVTRGKFTRGSTFDSGATPKVGETLLEPGKVATVDLDALRDAMAATLDRAAATDPAHLQARIADLEHQLAAARADQPGPVEPDVVEVQVPFVPAEVRALVAEVEKAAGEALDELDAARAGIAELVDAATAAAGTLHHAAQEPPRPSAPARAPKPRPAPSSGSSSPGAAAPARNSGSGEAPKLKAGARRMLDALADHHPLQLSRANVATLANLKRTGGTFTAYWSSLVTAGLIEETNGLTHLTPAGIAATDAEHRTPASPDQVLNMWLQAIKKAGARTMLEYLVEAHPRHVPRSELAAYADLTESGGTFASYLSLLHSNDLIVKHPDGISAADILAKPAGRAA